MKCSLKDGFINILLLICITPTKGIEYPLFLHKSSVLDKPMNLQQFRASINRLQDLDSFPDNGDNRLHRIVKKQMATCDYREARKSKRSVVPPPERRSGFLWGSGDGAYFNYKDDRKAERTADKDLGVLKLRSTDSTDSSNSFLRKLKDFAREKDLMFVKKSKEIDLSKTQQFNQLKQEALKKEKDVEEMLKRLKDKLTGKDNLKEEKLPVKHNLKGGKLTGKDSLKEKQAEEHEDGNTQLRENTFLAKHFSRIPDQHDYRYYYECESHPNGCLKLRHKRCPQGQFFSFKYLKCLKVPHRRIKKNSDTPEGKKVDLPEGVPEDPEPANEWLDATGSSNQKIPSEFKPKKKPKLKFYHLRPKRKLDGILGGEMIENHHFWSGNGASHGEKAIHGMEKKHGTRHHLPRSYVIRINKKEEEDQITENDENENDNDEEDEETDEEDEDEEADDEDDEGEEEDAKDVPQEKPAFRESFRDLLKSAKAAVTNRARFDDPLELSSRASYSHPKFTSSLKSKKSNDSTGKENKKVLIDANIKVDSTISSALKNFVKSKRKDKEGSNGLTDEYETLTGLPSQDPEGPTLYEHLMQNNPRVKRYYMVNCAERGNQ